MSRIKVYWHGHNHAGFELVGDKPRSTGVFLESIDGFTAAPNVSTVDRSTGRGAVVSGFSWPVMTGTLTVLVAADPSRSMSQADVWREFKESFSTTRHGELVVTDSRGTKWRARCRLAEPIPVPEFSPTSRYLSHLQMTVPLVCDEGLWATYPLKIESPEVPITNRGSVSTHPVVVWTGNGKTVTPHTIRNPVQLPSVTREHPRYLHTDPGEGFKVTDANGAHDTLARSAMRGRAVPGEIMPGETRKWGFSDGVWLELTEYTENPWG